jgi:glycosyltransferase involved in cell wall biosynthesis
MDPTDVSISCVVCTARAPSSIERLFESLLVQDWQASDELVVIDNGIAADRRAEVDLLLQSFRNRGVAVQFLREETPGVVSARIKSINASKNKWLFSLDDDNSAGPGVLAKIRERLRAFPALGGICPRIEPVWELPPPPWVVALGHQVLSYNSSTQDAAPEPWTLWPPKVIGRRPPTGGMVILRSVGEDFVQLSAETPSILRFTPKGRRRFTGEDFILYSLIYLRDDLSTAYDDSIVVQHLIPARRMKLGYLLATMFWSNYSFGIQGLMRFGKLNVLYVLLRGGGRLLIEMTRQSVRVLSWQIVLGFLVGFAGFLFGVLNGLFDSECKRIRIDP